LPFNHGAQNTRSLNGPSFGWIVSPLVGAYLFLCVMPIFASENAGSGSTSAGQRMFFGETPVRGTILGHDRPLPPELVKCANCHAAGSTAASGESFGPRLDRSTLADPRSRRGGPPSRFSAASFCHLLRTGVDPAYIVISRQMPRYELKDDQCVYLWQYLTEASDGSRE
jgi:hypothetical protein